MQRIEYYENYRDFLRDYFIDRKKRFSFFSNRYFCKKAGLKSPSLYQEVVEGKRNLTEKTLQAFIKGLGLTDRDSAFFSALVNLNQSRTDHERDIYLKQLKTLRNKINPEVIPADHYEYYAHWYNPVIRELVCIIDWKEDYEILASALNPPIRKKEAQESVELLLRIGFISKNENGSYQQNSPAITSGEHIKSVGIRSLNRQFSELGTRALDTFTPEERYISSMTVGISRQSYSQILQEIEEFKDRIRRIVDEDKSSDCVYSVNLQAFPLSIKNRAPEND